MQFYSKRALGTEDSENKNPSKTGWITLRMDQDMEKLAQESEETGKSGCQEGELIRVCLCHMYCMGKVIVIGGPNKSKVRYLIERLGERKLVRIMISEMIRHLFVCYEITTCAS